MSDVKTGAIEAWSNDDNRFGIKLDGEWYNGFGDLPDKFQEKGKVVEINYETNKNNGKTYRNVEDVEDDLELVEDGNENGESGDDSANSATNPVSDRQENIGRQKPIEAVGNMYQGCPPEDASELNSMKVILKELTNWSQQGEFMVDAQEVEGSNGDLKEKVNELAESLGRMEQKLSNAMDAIDKQGNRQDKVLSRLDKIEGRVDELEDEDMDVLFDEDDDEEQDTPEDASELTDGNRDESKVTDDEEENDNE